jgi:N-carbamoyl-L-amino-acid hydrolase
VRATAGVVKVSPGIVTAFNGTCEVSLDQRSLDTGVLADMLATAKAESERIAQEEGCTVAWEQVWEIEPIPFDPELIELADESIRAVTTTSHRLPSGPLHDAAEMARVMPTVMLFVKSLGGVSHTKEEDTPIADLELSVRALDELTRRTLAWAGGAS